MKPKILSHVIKDSLCTGCGTCFSFCPQEAILIKKDKEKGIYIPHFDKYKCNNCEICINVCPAYEIDFKRFNLDVYPKEHENELIGDYLNCHSGHSKDYNIQYNSSSGGLITQILIYALENRIIDGAIVTRMKKDNPLEPEPFVARTKKEIIEASKSKYCPVPVNISLKEILESNEEKFAVVGLPCHLHGIEKASKINRKLKNKIVFKFGIFCNHAPNFSATELYLNKMGIKKEEITKLDYRGNGWPGYMTIYLKNKELKVSLPEYWSFIGSQIFTPISCLMCPDGTSESSDISFGDAWLPEYGEDNMGTSIIITRSEKGDELLQKMKSENKIKLNEVSAEKVIKSQLNMLYLKKKNVNARYKLFRKYSNSCKSDYGDYPIALFLFLSYHIFSNPFSMKMLEYLPFKIIWLYNVFFSVICSKKAKKDFEVFY